MKICECNQGRLPCTCRENLEGWTSVSDKPVPTGTSVHLKGRGFKDNVYRISEPDLNSPVLMRSVDCSASTSCVSSSAYWITNEDFLAITHWKYAAVPQDGVAVYPLYDEQAAKEYKCEGYGKGGVYSSTYGPLRVVEAKTREGAHCVILGLGSTSEHDHCVLIGAGLTSDRAYQVKIGNSEVEVSRQMTHDEFMAIFEAMSLLTGATDAKRAEMIRQAEQHRGKP
jgi:hypothetical protein